MRCPSCATELLHAANFCPVCGTRLGPPSDGSAAQQVDPPHPGPHIVGPADAPAPPEHEPAASEQNVVYLHPQGQGVPANPHAHDYAPAADPGASPGAAPSGFELNVLGELVPVTPPDARAAMAWVDGPQDREFRFVGTLTAAASVSLLLSALGIYVIALVEERGGGAEAGGFVLLAAIAWVIYLSLPRDQQHERLLRMHAAVHGVLDRYVDPLRARTRVQLRTRRERERYRSMVDERARRVTALGEVAYRAFRQGALDPAMHETARRVMAMEQQMVVQDARLRELVAEEMREQEAAPADAESAPADS